ncbi:unnamed protein product [Diamesa tonsa]
MSSAKSHSQMIPSMKRIFISEASQMPDNYSTTPNGTCYGTTPGGTKIIYEKTFLLNLRNSPLSRTPPTNVGDIPCHLLKTDSNNYHKKNHQNHHTQHSPSNLAKSPKPNADDQFDMDI